MFHPVEAFVGLRYTRARRRNHFISFISLSSMLGIALGVTALITVLSVMNGFERELKTRILGMTSHAVIVGATGHLAGWRELYPRAEKARGVIGVAPFIEAQAMLTRGSLVRGAVVRGVIPDLERRVLAMDRYVVAGSVDALVPGRFGIVLGAELARSLGARVGSQLTLVAPQASVTPAGVAPRLRRFTVVAVFEAGHGEFDGGLAFVHLDDAARLFRYGDAVSGLRLEFEDLFDAPRLGRLLASELGSGLWVRDWTQLHSNFFRALRTEKTVMFVILTLIVAVAAFNIVATLVMVVTEKRSDIAILRTLGAPPRSILAIFIIQGTVIGVVGTLLGTIGGIALAYNVESIVPFIERLFDTKFLSPDIYYISDVPSDLRWPDVGLVTGVAFVLCVAATLYPAWRGSRTQPAEALRHE